MSDETNIKAVSYIVKGEQLGKFLVLTRDDPKIYLDIDGNFLDGLYRLTIELLTTDTESTQPQHNE